MTRWTGLLTVMALGVGFVGCDDAKPPARVTRAQVKRTGPATMEIIPVEGQLPYCMLFTMSEKGVIRQLTLTRENRSIRCDPGRPVANTSFRVPVQEGKVRIYIFFSDERVPAGSVAQQLYDLRDRERVTAMDLRLPGRVFVETLEFTPETGEPEQTGGIVGAGGVVTSDGGTAQDAGTRALTMEPLAN
ncbi:hypothetical protein NR800_18845 [Corallococcus interemptor]|uniref:hypothetical protein n=1 Tax=Corallococcus TaxID=83461 RepID=UPI001CBFF801|nr:MULTISPECIES: hypothetical protein [unclassified Corallococcus]MBZ4331195.1 hypothetical protein [Corallococcus sp. AS-1-12]MBZ4370452.1 hypothetical protein [Corallococcus sp. AS-1-6]